MPLTDLAIFSMLKTKMRWHNGRQTVLAENVANADTPDYRARDLKALSFSDLLAGHKSRSGLETRLTHQRHIGGMGPPGPEFGDDGAPDWEVTPEGNAVHIEDQMMKVAENQMDYQMVTSIYNRSISLLKTAIGRK